MEPGRAAAIATELMTKHGLDNWKFTFDNAKKRCGFCSYNRRTIGLSLHYVRLNDEELVRNTILHEIAHALVGPAHGHDKVWHKKATEIGCVASRVNRKAQMPKGKYRAQCPTCGREHHRHRMTSTVYACACDRSVPYKYRELKFTLSQY